MFKVAIRDSLKFCQSHFLVFLSIILLIEVNHLVDYKFMFKELNLKDFLSFESLAVFIFVFICGLIYTYVFTCMYMFKKHKVLSFKNIFSQYKMRLTTTVYVFLFLFALTMIISIVMVAFYEMDFISDLSMFSIYNHFSQSSSFLYLMTCAYIALYFLIHLMFGINFALIEKGKNIYKSVVCSFKLIKYKKILLIIVASFAYVFVVVSLAKFFIEISSLFMPMSAIDFIKLGMMNFYGYLYYFINISAICLVVMFLISLSVQLHESDVAKD